MQRLLEEGADCKAVITQISAAQAALQRAGLRLMAAGMRECLADHETGSGSRDGADDGDAMSIEAMEELFLKLR